MKKLNELFTVILGRRLTLNRMTIATADTGVPFISRKMRDNGIAAYVKPLSDCPISGVKRRLDIGTRHRPVWVRAG
jgi:hypothetical protein